MRRRRRVPRPVAGGASARGSVAPASGGESGAPGWSRPSGRGWRGRILQLATAGGWALALGGVLLLVGRGMGDLVVVLVGIAGTLVVLRGVGEPRDRLFLARLVVAGLLIRAGLALVAYYLLPVGFFAPDQYTYQDVGWRTLLWMRGEQTRPWQISGTEVGYVY